VEVSTSCAYERTAIMTEQHKESDEQDDDTPRRYQAGDNHCNVCCGRTFIGRFKGFCV
jgi:hypothetical protein